MSQPLSDQVDRGFHWLSLRFIDPDLESRFIQEHNRRATGPLRVVVVLLAIIVIIQTCVEYYGVVSEPGADYDAWFSALPYRVFDVAVLIAGLYISTKDWAIRHGQPIVALFLIILYAFFMMGADIGGAWIERTATLFNFTVTLAIVALGLLFRFAAPLVTVMSLGFAPVVAKFMDNPFAPLFILFATVITMSWVAYSIERARRDGVDVLLIDTAGRLHNKAGLMEELKKVIRVIRKLDESAPHDVLLVLDATTGQNAIAQVETFKEMVDITGLVVTKLDGTAKGGVLVALAEKFGLPVHAIGIGEQADDLRPFAAKDFARGLMGLED